MKEDEIELMLDRRKLLHAGIAFAVPLGGISLLSGCQPSESKPETDENSQPKDDGSQTSNSEIDEIAEPVATSTPEEESEGNPMQIQYLEIVTPEVDALCKQYSEILGVTFSEPVAEFGNARTAKLNGGGQIGIRGPMRESETPIVRPYVLVEDIDGAVAKAAEAGAEVAMPAMEIPGQGKFAIVIQGGINCGFWQV